MNLFQSIDSFAFAHYHSQHSLTAAFTTAKMCERVFTTQCDRNSETHCHVMIAAYSHAAGNFSTMNIQRVNSILAD